MRPILFWINGAANTFFIELLLFLKRECPLQDSSDHRREGISSSRHNQSTVGVNGPRKPFYHGEIFCIEGGINREGSQDCPVSLY